MNRNEGEAMSDLISRRELIENFRKCYRGHLGMENSDSCMTFHGICNVINNTNTSYDIDRVVEEMKKAKHTICLSDDDLEHYQNGIDRAIEIVKQGGVSGASDDVCEYKIKDKVVYASCNNKQIASAFCWFNECGDYKYCPYCGKRIKVVE